MKKSVTPPPSHMKPTGFKIRCKFCDTWVSETCRNNGRELIQCSHADDLEYISVIHLKNTKHGRRIKVHKTKNLNEALIAHLQFRDQVQGNSTPTPPIETPVIQKQEKEIATTKVQERQLLTEWAASFYAYMCDINVPSHLKQNLTASYLKEIDREMKRLCVCLSKHVDIRSFSMQQINDEAVGYLCDYLLGEKKYSNRSFNKHINTYATFYSWWQKKTLHAGENFFSKVRRRDVTPNPQTFDSSLEFEQFLAQITPENGRQYLPGTKNEQRNLYRPWLKTAYRIGIETGARRENLVLFKTSDIIEDASGPVVLRVENIKVNNIMHLSEEKEKRHIFIPITQTLLKIIRKSYEEYKRNGVDQYLVAPEITEKRESAMLDILSRAFSHYYKQLGTGKQLAFGSLRKAYITQMEIFTGGRAESVTGHSNKHVKRHYVVPEIVARAARGFAVFPEEDGRKRELTAARKKPSNRKNIER